MDKNQDKKHGFISPSHGVSATTLSAAETTAVSLAGVPGDTGNREIRKRVLKEIRLAGAEGGSLLLYGMDGFSDKNILAVVEAALQANCSELKVEIGIAQKTVVTIIRRLFDHGVAEIFVRIDDYDEKMYIAALKRTARDNKAECEAGRLKIRSAVSGLSGTKNILNAAAACGIRHIVLEVSGGEKNRERIFGVGAREAERRDSILEIDCSGERRVFRGPGFRKMESEKLFLDLPAYGLGGRRIPLAAVFQLNFACNQKCMFCTADRTLPPVNREYKNEQIEYALELGVTRAVFTGGEPTLDRDLSSMISRCAESGVREISVYSNGMAFSSQRYTKTLADAGMNCALISLHSALPAVADRITGRAGGQVKTVRGIKNLLAAEIFVAINYVINGLNYKETPDFVKYVADEFPGAVLNFSWVAPIADQSADPALIPKYSDATPYLFTSLNAGESLSVSIAGLEPHWGIPPCALGEDWKRYLPVLLPLAGRYPGFIKPESCNICMLSESCPGVRKNYAYLYGTDELIPVQN